MKKLLCIMLAIVIWTDVAASAAAMLYEPMLSIHYQQLQQEQQALLLMVYDRLEAGESDITFDVPVNYDDLALVMEILAADFPEISGLDQEWSVKYYRDTPQQATGMIVSWTMPGAGAPAVESAIQALAQMPEADVLNRILAIHDQVCMDTIYSDEGTLPHDAWGALVEGKAVCEGYSKAMVLLCRLSGIPASMVSGMAWNGTEEESHAWVMLKIGDDYTQTDVTWDDREDWISYDLYQVNDAMLCHHSRDELSMRLPACERSDLNWHALTGNMAPEGKKLRSFLAEKLLLLKAGEMVRLRFTSQQVVDTAIDLFRHSVGFTYYRDSDSHCLTIIP